MTRRRRAAAALALASLLLPALACAARVPRARPGPGGAVESAGVRYRGWVRAGESLHRLRVDAYAAGSDRVRLEVRSPLGHPLLSAVARGGDCVILAIRHRTVYRPAGEEQLAEAGLVGGPALWADALLGRTDRLRERLGEPARLARGAVEFAYEGPGGGRLRVRYDRPMRAAPVLLEATTRLASLRLERVSSLDPPDPDAAFLVEVPEGFEEGDFAELGRMIAEDGDEGP